MSQDNPALKKSVESFHFSHFEAKVSPEDGFKIAKAYGTLVDQWAIMLKSIDIIRDQIELIRSTIITSPSSEVHPQPSSKE